MKEHVNLVLLFLATLALNSLQAQDIETGLQLYSDFEQVTNNKVPDVSGNRRFQNSQFDHTEQPVDYTWAISNPSFEEGAGGTLDSTSYLDGRTDGYGAYTYPKGWTVYLNHTGWCNAVIISTEPSHGSRSYETWAESVKSFNVYQDVELIRGSYELTAKVRTNQLPPYTQRIYAITAFGDTINSETLIDSLVIHDSDWYTKENWQKLSCRFMTKTGKVRLGFKSEGFMQFDDMRLVYKGGRNISTDTTIVTVGTMFQLPIKASNLSPFDSIISYQFKMTYDTTKLEYVNHQTAGTLSCNGLVSVNNDTTGLLKIGYIGTEFLSGSGPLINLQFNAVQTGEVKTAISDFYFNTDTISQIFNGPVELFTEYGDVDGNDKIQAYDGALALQYSVGLEPLPYLDPLPWSNWRVVATDVDGVDGITGNDAAMILQRSIDLIGHFPVHSMLRSSSSNNAEVVIVQEGDKLVFKSFGGLIGLNVFVDKNRTLLGPPSISEHFISAINITDDTYAFGIATAYAPSDGNTILTIPVNTNELKTITFSLIVNSEQVNISATIASGLTGENKNDVLLYPNPVVDKLHLSYLEVGSIISIIDLAGRVLMTQTVVSPSETLSVSRIPSGLYHLMITTNGINSLSKFVKK